MPVRYMYASSVSICIQATDGLCFRLGIGLRSKIAHEKPFQLLGIDRAPQLVKCLHFACAMSHHKRCRDIWRIGGLACPVATLKKYQRACDHLPDAFQTGIRGRNISGLREQKMEQAQNSSMTGLPYSLAESRPCGGAPATRAFRHKGSSHSTCSAI